MKILLSQIGKLSFSALFVLSLILVGLVAAQAQPAGQNPPPKGKKKLPAGSKGFAQFAGRDASDKLITGGATRSVDTDPKPTEAAYKEAIQSGTASYEEGKFKEALDAFKQAATAKPDDFVAQYSIGVTYEAMGQFKEAAEAYKRAVTLKPDEEHEGQDLLAHYNLGNTYAAAGHHKEAIEVYQQVLRREPRLSVVHYNMGLSYAVLNQPKEAIGAFNEALSLKPKRDVELIHYNLGLAYGKSEQYSEAAEAFKQALILKPDYPDARYNLGLIYYMLDNQSALIEQHKILQTMKPEMASELAKLIGK